MKILVIAGPNGAGKTTFARRYLKREGDRRRFVNGDDIAAKLRPDDPAAVAQKAGRLALREMEAHVARGEDFATETTLSGRAYAKRIRRWRAAGYRVAIIYLRVLSADHSVARVAQRVREGGHHIPEPVIRRRFERSWRTSATFTGRLWTTGGCTTIPARFRFCWRSPRNGIQSASRARSGGHQAPGNEPQMSGGNK